MNELTFKIGKELSRLPPEIILDAEKLRKAEHEICERHSVSPEVIDRAYDIYTTIMSQLLEILTEVGALNEKAVTASMMNDQDECWRLLGQIEKRIKAARKARIDA
jgi:hypothetical protein